MVRGKDEGRPGEIPTALRDVSAPVNGGQREPPASVTVST